MKYNKKEKKDIEILKNQDSTIFKVKYLERKILVDNFYYGFINNKNIYLFEESFECAPIIATDKAFQKLAKPIKYVSAERKYNNIEYVNDDNILYPKSITRRYEYSNVKDEKNPIKMIMRVYVKTIPKPNFDFELGIKMVGNITEYMKAIKEQYPKLIIPDKE